MHKRSILSLGASLILVLLSIPAVVRADVRIPVDQVVSKLQKQTQVPILIPPVIPDMRGIRIYVGIGETNASSYTLYFDFTPDCGGSTPCHYGGIAAEVGKDFFVLDPQVAAFNPANVVEPVSLANGTQGQFANTCGPYCIAAVEWKYEGALYRVHIKNGRKADVLKLANAAIAAGPRTTTTATKFPDHNVIYGRKISPGLSAYLTSKEAGTPINIRDEASTKAYARHIGYKDDLVRVLERAVGEDQYYWYRVQFRASGAKGWVRGDFLVEDNED